MDLKRLGLGKRIAAGGAIVLFAVMFIDWFGIEAVSYTHLTLPTTPYV